MNLKRVSIRNEIFIRRGRSILNSGYVHTVTFLHGFVLFHNPKGIPIYFQTIENDAKTLPCAHSLNLPSKHELSLKCRSGLKLNPDSCKPPLTCNLKNYMTAETKYIHEYQLKMFYISFLNTQYGGIFEEERPILACLCTPLILGKLSRQVANFATEIY